MSNTSRLQQELKKKQPFDLLEQETLLNVVRTADQLQWHFARLFREHGLTDAQYNVLRILRGEGAPLPILEIASRTVAVVPGITRLIHRMEQSGWVSRTCLDDDRRVQWIALTDSGQALLSRLDEPVQRLHRELLGHMDASELSTASRLMEKMRAGVPSV